MYKTLHVIRSSKMLFMLSLTFLLSCFGIPVSAATIEYDQLRSLVTEGNPDLQKSLDTYYDNVAYYEDTIKELETERDTLKLLEEHASDENEKRQYKQSASMLTASLSRMRKTWQKQTQVNGSAVMNLEKTIDTYVQTAQTRMNAYNQMAGNAAAKEKSAAAAEKTYETMVLKQQAGAATQDAVDRAYEKLLQEQNALQSYRTQEKNLRFQLLSFLGIPDQEDVTIGSVPQLDAALIDAIDFESDLTAAVNNNSTVKNIRHGLAKTNSAIENKTEREIQAEGNEIANFTDLYEQLLAARTASQAEADSLAAAEITYHSLQLKKQAGMISEADYLSGEAAYLESKAKKDNADMTLYQLYQNYQLELKGVGGTQAARGR